MDIEMTIRILLVAESRDIKQEIKSALEHLDWEILEAETGERALALIAEFDFAVVLLDEHLLDINGFDLAERIRNNEITRFLPIIFLTSIPAPDAYMNRAYSLGAVDFIFSPMVPKLFTAKVAVFVELYSKTETLKRHAGLLEVKVRERTAELRYQLQINRALTDNAVSGLFLIDGEGLIAYMNPAAEKATGYRWQEARGKRLHELTHHSHPDGTPYLAAQCPIDLSLKNTIPIRNLEENFVNRAGKFFPVSCSVASLELEGGKAGAVLEFQDITDRKEAEARLRKSEDRYRRLFETAKDGILILEAEGGHIAEANPFLLELLGYSQEELLGKELWEIGLFKDIKSNQEAFQKLKKTGYIRYDDLPLKTKQGLRRDVEFVSNTYDVGNQSVIQCNIRDITERREAEKSLYITEEALRQSKKMDAMGKLSGGIAHDFNNVLTAINGYAGIALALVEPNAALHEYLAEILKAGERATSLTKQLLAFSRQQILAPKVLGLNAVVSDMHVMLTRLIGESIHIQENLDPDLGRVKADPIQMQQVLMNLVINARDAMPQGGEITITTSNVHLGGKHRALHPKVAQENYVLFSVRDTGTGMDADVKARAFDPFFTTKQFGKGSGMGLATVQGIVEQSGGHVSVESSPGKGSAFHIYLPRTDKEEERPIAPTTISVAADRGSETVLIAEDEAMVRVFIRKALELQGYKVLEAEDGMVALALLQSFKDPIHLLLTDLMMPNMGGRELAQKFSQLRPESNILFMSGYTDDIIAQQGLINEGDSFVQKPFSPTQLVKAIREVLDRTKAEAV